MVTHKYSEQELKFTAILYATRDEIVEQIRSTGKLPAKIALGGFPTAMNFIGRKRGFPLELSEREQLVYNAIIKEKRLPAGGVILFPGSLPIYSVESNQSIEVCSGPRDPDWE